MTTPFKGGDVKTDLVLGLACSLYTIDDDIRVLANAKLTIEPGVTLRFAADKELTAGYTESGQIVAEGTAALPILMTSKLASPGPGDWAGITFWAGTSNGSKLSYVKLDYCGKDDGCIVIDNGVKSDRITIDHVTIDHAGNDGIVENGADSRVKITNTTFPTGAIKAGKYAITVIAPSFAAIDGTNTFNGAPIELQGGTIETGNVNWVNPGTSITVTSNLRVEGSTKPVLNIGPGMTFKFGNDINFWIGYGDVGRLVVAGTVTSRVTFTSAATTPGKGDWTGIYLWGKGEADISFADISYAGYPGRGAVTVDTENNKLTMLSSTVNYSSVVGIYVDCDNKSTVLTAVTYTGNQSGDRGPTCP